VEQEWLSRDNKGPASLVLDILSYVSRAIESEQKRLYVLKKLEPLLGGDQPTPVSAKEPQIQ